MERGALEGEEEASDSIPEVPFTSTEQLAMEREAAQRRREQT